MPEATLTLREAIDRLGRPSSEELDGLFDFVASYPDPEEVVDEILRRYHRDRKMDHLTRAPNVLARMGQRAWPALKRVASTDVEVADAFVYSISRCEGVPLQERVRVLFRMMRHPEYHVAEEAFEAIGNIDGHEEFRRLVAENCGSSK